MKDIQLQIANKYIKITDEKMLGRVIERLNTIFSCSYKSDEFIDIYRYSQERKDVFYIHCVINVINDEIISLTLCYVHHKKGYNENLIIQESDLWSAEGKAFTKFKERKYYRYYGPDKRISKNILYCEDNLFYKLTDLVTKDMYITEDEDINYMREFDTISEKDKIENKYEPVIAKTLNGYYKIKTWESMAKEFTKEEISILCKSYYNSIYMSWILKMEEMCPKDRIIEIVDNKWEDWNIIDSMVEYKVRDLEEEIKTDNKKEESIEQELPELTIKEAQKIFDENIGYDYLAQNEDGTVRLYRNKPQISINYPIWYLSNFGSTYIKTYKEYKYGWQNSLFSYSSRIINKYQSNRDVMKEDIPLISEEFGRPMKFRGEDYPIFRDSFTQTTNFVKPIKHGSIEEQQFIITTIHRRVK